MLPPACGSQGIPGIKTRTADNISRRCRQKRPPANSSLTESTVVEFGNEQHPAFFMGKLTYKEIRDLKKDYGRDDMSTAEFSAKMNETHGNDDYSAGLETGMGAMVRSIDYSIDSGLSRAGIPRTLFDMTALMVIGVVIAAFLKPVLERRRLRAAGFRPIICPDCDFKMNVPERQVGQTIKCAGCQNEFTAEPTDRDRPRDLHPLFIAFLSHRWTILTVVAAVFIGVIWFCRTPVEEELFLAAFKAEQKTNFPSYAIVEQYRKVISHAPTSSWAEKAQRRIDAIQGRLDAQRLHFIPAPTW
jgi:hypothetical protein